jgi:hypothetical protein
VISGIRIRIRIRIKVMSLIRIRINLQMASQNVRNMNLFEDFFQVLSLYLEARIRNRIRIKVMRIRNNVHLGCPIFFNPTSSAPIRSTIEEDEFLTLEH